MYNLIMWLNGRVAWHSMINGLYRVVHRFTSRVRVNVLHGLYWLHISVLNMRRFAVLVNRRCCVMRLFVDHVVLLLVNRGDWGVVRLCIDNSRLCIDDLMWLWVDHVARLLNMLNDLVVHVLFVLGLFVVGALNLMRLNDVAGDSIRGVTVMIATHFDPVVIALRQDLFVT